MSLSPAPKTWPADIVPASSTFSLVPLTRDSRSPWTRKETVFDQMGSLWTAQFTFPVLTRDKWKRLSAFLHGLRGRVGLVRLSDPLRCYPGGNAAGPNPGSGAGVAWSDGTFFTDGFGWVDGSSYGRSGENAVKGADNILMTGLVANALALEAGDLFQIGDHLYETAIDANSDGSGESRVYFAPNLVADVFAGDAINFHKPTGVFRMVDDAQGLIERGVKEGAIGISFVQVIE